jgi:hypothetical protein
MNGGCGKPHRPAWRVYNRMCNYSSFNGRRRTPSAYSALVCLHCFHVWRTKAAYVRSTPDITHAEAENWHGPRVPLALD